MTHRLRTQIFVFFLALLLVVMGGVLYMVYRATESHTEALIAERLETGFTVVRNELETRARYVGGTAGTIAKDFSLIEQVVSRDAPSIAATLLSYRDRAGADFVLASDLEGKLIAGTLPALTPGAALNFGEKLANGIPNDHSTFAIHNGHAYQVFIWPLFAPEPNQVAWLIIGFALDDALAARLHKLTGLDISLLQQGKVMASSLTETQRLELGRRSKLIAIGHSRLKLNERDYVLYSQSLDGSVAAPITVLLQRSLTEALSEYRMLHLQLIAIQLASLAIAALGAFFIANTVSHPLSRMSEYVKRIAQGEYSEPPPLPEKGEIGVLAKEFANMQHQIAEREAANRHLAYHDGLTDLPNRNAFQASLTEAINQASQQIGHLAVLVMDIDYFKDINDTLGHVTGDTLLKQFAHRLEAVRRPQDQLARLGGDQFAVLVPALEIEAAAMVAQHYREAWQEPFTIEGFTLSLTAKLGIAIYPEHGENAVTLLQRAEVAMYVSKKQKKPYTFYDTRLDHNSVLRLALMSELRSAIDRQELTLHYQPKLDIGRGQIIGVECLVRWQHPVHGFIPPDDFIALAEQTGNIRYLTQWVLRTALGQTKAWREQGWALKTAVNISAVDLSDPLFPNQVESLLAELDLPADVLVLEITESAVMEDAQRAVQLLTQLQGMGVRLSIDDYGTGYSSMAQLKRLPVHELKIDKSFVLDVINNPDDAIIVRSTIELGHNMALTIVAEGVENAQSLDLLRTLGCDIAQGYYLSKPLPAPAFEQWLATAPYPPRTDNTRSYA